MYQMHQISLALLLTFVCASHQTGHTQLGSTCLKSDDCGTFTVCSEKSHQCKCFYGYSPEADNINCQPHSCSTESDCTAKYGAHSICGSIGNASKTCQCDISSGWTFNMETLSSCLPMKVLLNQPCANETACGTFAYCDLKADQPKCKCKFGFKPDLKGEINCGIIICQTDADCAQSDPHAQCDRSFPLFPCSCKYESGYVQDFNNNRCIPRSQFIEQNCSKGSKLTCGANAICSIGNTTNTCKCLIGFAPKSNQMDCTQLHCTSDAQCQQLDSNTKCFESQNCICKLKYKYDMDRQVCVYSSADALIWTTNFYSILPLFVIMLYNVM